MNGVLVVDKPAGPTSHDVVAIARRALRERRIGHTGTLDPMATGVLPLVIGKATRLAVLLSSSEKEYEAAVRLGGATATYDAAERLAAGSPPPAAPEVSREAVEQALDRFRGAFEQVPPPFSAKKVGGVRAYKLAREERPADLPGVPVTVHALELLEYEGGLVRLRVRASAGFYVRSLAHDLGAVLGCGGHLEALRRTAAGVFRLPSAVPLEGLLEQPDAASRRLIPMNALLADVPAARLSPSGAKKAAHGNPLIPGDFAEMGPDPISGAVRLVGPGGELLGIAQAGGDGVLRPSIVLV